MPQRNAAAPTESAEGFLGSVFKFSISTYVNFAVYGIGLLLINYLVPNKTVNGDIQLFISTLNLLMTVGILGLDQSLIRFYNEPPAGLSSHGLFRSCLYVSGIALVAAGLVCGVFFRAPLLRLFDFKTSDERIVPLLFLGAIFYMIARYFNVLYRMEQNILLYTVESILMNFFFRLFYLLGAFFENQMTAMMLCSVGGLCAFALLFSVWRRDTLRPQGGELCASVLRTTLPYGLQTAPTAVLIHLNNVISLSLAGRLVNGDARGVYGYGVALSNIVTTVQAGFASFWGAYMFANYKTQQPRIKRVHEYLNFIILVFFALLVGFEDVLFLILSNYRETQTIFPLMMLAAVFTILCETTVYGIAIAKRPIFDTIGIGLAFGLNVLLCLLLLPALGLVGGAMALAAGNLGMYLFRTLIAQRFYRTIQWPLKTALALALAVALAAAGTVFAARFWLKLAAAGGAITIYILLYRREFIHLVRVALSYIKSLFSRTKA